MARVTLISMHEFNPYLDADMFSNNMQCDTPCPCLHVASAYSFVPYITC